MSVEELRARRLHPPGTDKVSPRFELIPVEPVGMHEGTTMVYDSRTGAHVVASAVDTYPPSPRGDQLRRARIGGFHHPFLSTGSCAMALGIWVNELAQLEGGQLRLASDEEWDRAEALIRAAQGE